MHRLSSCVFSELGLHCPLEDSLENVNHVNGLHSYRDKYQDTEREKDSDDKSLQMLFSASVPLECMASTSLSLLISVLRQMLLNTLADSREGGDGVRMRLSNKCKLILPNLLNMVQFAHTTASTTTGVSEFPVPAHIGTRTGKGTGGGGGTGTGGCIPQSVGGTRLFSMMEGMCLAMVVRVVSDTIPQAQDLFRYVSAHA